MALRHLKMTLYGCITAHVCFVTDWLKWVLHHSVDTTCVSVVLFILLAIQLMIRHSSSSGTGAVGLNAKSSQKPIGAMCIVLQPQGA